MLDRLVIVGVDDPLGFTPQLLEIAFGHLPETKLLLTGSCDETSERVPDDTVYGGNRTRLEAERWHALEERQYTAVLWGFFDTVALAGLVLVTFQHEEKWNREYPLSRMLSPH